MARIYTSLDEIEKYFREHLPGTTVTKIPLIEKPPSKTWNEKDASKQEWVVRMTTFCLEDTIYKDGIPQEKKLWWGRFNIYELKKGRGIDGTCLLENVQKAFSGDNIQGVAASIRYDKKVNELMTDILEKFGKPRNKAGRERYEEDIWAYEQIHIHGRDPFSVKPEWIEKVRLNSQRNYVGASSMERQFNKIKKPEWINRYNRIKE